MYTKYEMPLKSRLPAAVYVLLIVLKSAHISYIMRMDIKYEMSLKSTHPAAVYVLLIVLKSAHISYIMWMDTKK